MSLDAIRDQLPDYARDLKLNLGSVLTPQRRARPDRKQIASIALSTAIAARNPAAYAGDRGVGAAAPR